MSKIWMYAHGGSGNHGCEAIVRSTYQILSEELRSELTLISSNPQEDKKYGLDKLCAIEQDILPYKKNSLSFAKAYLTLKTKSDYVPMDKLNYKTTIDHIRKNDIAMSIGGDNYCYADVKKYIMLHDMILERGAKTVLWGCSVDPELLKNTEISADIKRYQLITARETITYNALKTINPNTVLTPDPAFFMDPVTCELPTIFDKGNVIGINISPMIISNENQKGVTYQNYFELIRYILSNTDCSVALIPHVVWQTNDDRTVLQKLYEDIDNNERVVLISDHTAPELKYIISHCECFVGARTHATIAAYSTAVPTLVVGYSVKARGIAKDLFGSEDNYVIPVQSLISPEQLINAFYKIYHNKVQIKQHLQEVLPQYKREIDAARTNISNL